MSPFGCMMLGCAPFVMHVGKRPCRPRTRLASTPPPGSQVRILLDPCLPRSASPACIVMAALVLALRLCDLIVLLFMTVLCSHAGGSQDRHSVEPGELFISMSLHSQHGLTRPPSSLCYSCCAQTDAKSDVLVADLGQLVSRLLLSASRPTATADFPLILFRLLLRFWARSCSRSRRSRRSRRSLGPWSRPGAPPT